MPMWKAEMERKKQEVRDSLTAMWAPKRREAVAGAEGGKAKANPPKLARPRRRAWENKT